jgi:hypothetical protein
MSEEKRGKNTKIIRLMARYEALATQLSKTGLILQGTITERSIESGEDKEKVYGPYYQWTRKIKQKTVTVNLSRSQTKVYQKAIDNNKKLEKIIKEMLALSMKILEATTEGVKKRKSKQNQQLKP